MAQQWNAERYACEAGFVATLGEPLIDLLAPRSNEQILDLGCGDGALTEKLLSHGCKVIGVDSSREQVTAAVDRGIDAYVVDGHELKFDNEFDGVISNAALHWMKHPDAVLAGVSRALVTDGRFVGEFGGAGNVARIVTGIEAILIARGIDPETVNPWYFPGSDEYAQRLQAHSFEIMSLEHFPRPTPLQVDISAWLEIFTLSFFNTFDNDERTTLLTELREDLRGDLCDANGNWEVDYVRLRFSAIKRAHL